MSIKDLVPKFGRERESVSVQRANDNPFHDFQRDMNRLFDNFFGDLAPARRRSESEWTTAVFSPRIDVSETDQEIRVAAELPGMDEKDITVEMDDEAITIRGERKEEKEDKGKNWYRREQSYGSFHRIVPLPSSVEGAKAQAKFKKGVLTVTAPKRESSQAKRKTIAIETD